MFISKSSISSTNKRKSLPSRIKLLLELKIGPLHLLSSIFYLSVIYFLLFTFWEKIRKSEEKNQGRKKSEKRKKKKEEKKVRKKKSKFFNLVWATSLSIISIKSIFFHQLHQCLLSRIVILIDFNKHHWSNLTANSVASVALPPSYFDREGLYKDIDQFNMDILIFFYRFV